MTRGPAGIVDPRAEPSSLRPARKERTLAGVLLVQSPIDAKAVRGG
jgi:hypothetical protein